MNTLQIVSGMPHFAAHAPHISDRNDSFSTRALGALTLHRVQYWPPPTLSNRKLVSATLLPGSKSRRTHAHSGADASQICVMAPCSVVTNVVMHRN